MEGELFHTDGLTDLHSEASSHLFGNFAKAPKNCQK